MWNASTTSRILAVFSRQTATAVCRSDIRRRIALAASVMSSLRNIWKDQRLSLSTKSHIYQTLVVSVLLYASETWTLLAADVKTEACHMKCQRQILSIRWQDHVRNDEVAARTGLRPVMESIRRRREAIFGHVARMSPNIPAHQALRQQVETSLGRRPDRDWVRSSGRPRNRWIDQLRQDHQRPPAYLWRAGIRRGHTGATLRSSTTTRWRRWRVRWSWRQCKSNTEF